MSNEIKLENHIGLVKSIVKKYIKNNIYMEDSEEYADGLIGLHKAIKNFKENQNTAFQTYAYHCIKNAILDGIKNRNDEKNTNFIDFDLSKVLEDFDFSQYTKLDMIKIIQSIIEPNQNDTEDEKINKEIIKLYYLDHKTWEQIGKIFNLTKMRVFQRGKEYIQQLKNKYKDYSIIDLID